MSEPRSTLHARRRHAAAAATAAAGVVHVAAAGPHLSQGWVLAASFLVVGMLQLALGLGLAIRRGGRFTGLGAGGVHVMALVAWALSRTVGLPAFLHPGVEPVGLADAIAASMELAAVVLLAWRAARPAPMGRSRAASVTVFTFVWVLAITGTAAGLGDIADTRDGHHAADHEATGHHDAVPHDPGTVEDLDAGNRGTTRPRPQPKRSSEVVHSDPPPEVAKEQPEEAVPTSPATLEEHTHAPGEGH